MKKLITSAVALTLLMGGPALAGDKDKDKHGGGGQQQSHQGGGGGGGGGKHDNGGGGGGGGQHNNAGGGGGGGGGKHDNGGGGGGYNPNGGKHDNNGPNWNANQNNNKGPNWNGANNNRGPNWNGNKNRNNNANWNRQRPRTFDRRAYQRNAWAQHKYRAGYYHRPPGWYYRRWSFGQVLPFAFFASSYWLNDWYAYDLPTPPYGYEWVRYGDDAILVDVRSGMILQVMYGVFY